MNMKINTICFILLLFILIGVVNASDNNNETLQLNNNEKIEVSMNETAIAKNIALITNVASKDVKTTTKLKVNLKAPDVKMHYKDGSAFKISLKDNNKKVMKNSKVKIEINGKTYNKVTDSKGTASVKLNFNSGIYKVITTYSGSGTYLKQSVKSTVTIKSTIKSSDLTKYYKNIKSFTSTFYDKKGKLLKETNVKFKLNGKTYSIKTNKYGVGKLSVDLNPGKYTVNSINPKTSESITNTITIKTTLETNDLTIPENSGSEFKVKVLNSYGKASPNKKVILNVNTHTYTTKTNQNGIASVKLDLDAGTYSITTEFNGLKNTNQITVTKAVVKQEVKKTEISHSISIPNYINVTSDYVFQNSAYALKTGINGIIKMPKNDLFTIKINGDKEYLFSQTKINNVKSNIIGYQYHLIPFNNSSIKSDFKKENLKGSGIIISKNGDFTEIEFRNTIIDGSNFLKVCANSVNHTQNIHYMFNDNLSVYINYMTCKYDESGVKYNLAKLYGENIKDYNDRSYIELTNNNNNISLKYTKTNENVKFNDLNTSIVSTISNEDIITKFSVDNCSELKKEDNLNYSDDFEFFEKYGIINEEISKQNIKDFISKCDENGLKFDNITQYLKENNIIWTKNNPITLFIDNNESLKIINKLK